MISGITQRNSHETSITFFLRQTYLFFRRKFGVINEAFGFGEKLLGGYITSLPIQVEEEVKAAVRILHGASPADMPIVESRKEYVVDWNTMTQIGLSKESIPAKYRIINISFSDKYPLFGEFQSHRSFLY